MTNKILFALGSLMALLAASQVWRSTAAPVTVTRAEFEALRAQIDRLSNTVTQRTATARAGAHDVELTAAIRQLQTQVAALQRENAPYKPDTAAQSAPSAAPIPQALNERLDETLQRGPDTADDRRLAAQLGPAITRSLPQRASLRHIACVSALCRAEISYPNAEVLQSFIETELSGSEGSLWQGPAFVHLASNPPPPGEVTAMLYLGRGKSGFE